MYELPRSMLMVKGHSAVAYSVKLVGVAYSFFVFYCCLPVLIYLLLFITRFLFTLSSVM